MPYRFERDELLKLLIVAYKEGNCGFLDLAESVADKLIEESESKYNEKSEPVWPIPYPDVLQNSSIVVTNYDSLSSTSLATGTIPNAAGPMPVFTLSSSTNNFSNEQVAIDSINITANHNLVITNSNELSEARWEPYSEANLIRKEV